jgi:hypothetical protein
MNAQDWLVKNGVSEKNAVNTMKIFNKLNALSKRDEVIETFIRILTKGGKPVNYGHTEDMADVFMSRKKWSAKRLRDLYEGKRGYQALTALHGISRGYGEPTDDFFTVFHKMVEAGNERRKGQFVGITGQAEQEVHLQWWRETAKQRG